ncbi:MAG: cyclophilin-like fold protein [Acidobacteriota bacterium]|nr:cyclophilin-like fold protein [Acidobacteriota bacterium]
MSTQRIRVVAAGIEIVARLNDSTTAEALWVALPITSQVETWGDEIYFSIPVEAPEAADAQDTVEQGAVAYWPPGTALCLFWGPTPMSRGDEIRPASAVNVVGRVEGDPATLARIPAGSEVRVEAAPAR